MLIAPAATRAWSPRGRSHRLTLHHRLRHARRIRFPIQAQPSQLWITTALDNERPTGPGAIMVARGYRAWRAIGRLKPGVTPAQAQSEGDVIAANLAAQFPDANKDMAIGVRPLRESIVGNVRPTLLLLLGRQCQAAFSTNQFENRP